RRSARRGPPSAPLDEHPAVALEVLRAVAAPREAILDLAQDLRTGGDRAREVRLDVVDVHEHAVDHPGNGLPRAGGLTTLAVVLRGLIFGARRRQHHEAAARAHFTVRQLAVRTRKPRALFEA